MKLPHQVIDKRAKEEITAWIGRLEEEISANSLPKDVVVEKIQELASLKEYLRDATKDNKPKYFQSPEYKKLKTSIGNSITNSINSIGKKENGDKIASHFKKSLSRIYSDKISYSPNPDIEWHT